MTDYSSYPEFCKHATERPALAAQRPHVRRTDGGDAALSKSHIPPRGSVKFYNGGSLIEYKKPKLPLQGRHVCGYRSAIKTFSRNSRRRLLYNIARIDRKELPLFVTLTYPNEYTQVSEDWKADLENWFKRLKRQFPDAAMVWKLEPQQRGAPHYHLLVWGVPFVDLYRFTPRSWYEVVGSQDPLHLAWHEGRLGRGNVHCVQEVMSWRGVWAYASKYLGKTVDVAGWEAPGRFWGVKNRTAIPWAEIEEVAITTPEAYKLLRLMRRYAGMKNRRWSSLTIFCQSPEFWAERLDRLLSP
jgi:hypothetical protein